MENKINDDTDTTALGSEPSHVVSTSSISKINSDIVTNHAKLDAIEVSSTLPGDKKSKDSLELATHHLAAGKKDLLISDPSAAVTSLSLACELLGSHFGEMAVECSEAYYYYGRALLELARLEGGVIEKQSEDSESEEERSTDGSQQEKSSEQLAKEGSVNGEKHALKGNPDGSEDHGATGVSDQESEKENEEEPSNLQLAWEMFELTKTILLNQVESIQIINAADDIEAEKKARTKADIETRISDTFQCLAELSIENENYAQAIEDLETCLTRRQQLMPEDTRSIAETHYQLGVAKGFNMQFDESVTSLETAIDVLQTRINKLNSKSESSNVSQSNDSSYSIEKEVKEIESLIPEIRIKIADTKDMKAEVLRKLGDKKLLEEGFATNISSGNTGSFSAGSSKVSSTISSSLIKKRPAIDSSVPEAKKIHLELSESENTPARADQINES